MDNDGVKQTVEEWRRVIGRELLTQLNGLRDDGRVRRIRMQNLEGGQASEDTIDARHPVQRPALGQTIGKDRVQASLRGSHPANQISRERAYRVGEDARAGGQDLEDVGTHESSLEQNVEGLFARLGPRREVSVLLDVSADALDLEVSDPLDGALVVRRRSGVRTHFSEIRPR